MRRNSVGQSHQLDAGIHAPPSHGVSSGPNITADLRVRGASPVSIRVHESSVPFMPQTSTLGGVLQESKSCQMMEATVFNDARNVVTRAFRAHYQQPKGRGRGVHQKSSRRRNRRLK